MTNVKIVIGGNFGDEGKGLLTAFFAQQMMQRSGRCLVVMSNGGPQRGHTVVQNGNRHVFRHFGSGTFCGADTYFPAQFMVNPMIFSEERDELAGIFSGALPDSPAFPKVFIHPSCLVTTPFEMITNLILEEHRGKKRYGSVGVGIWETVIGGGKNFEELAGMSAAQIMDYLEKDRRAHMIQRLQSNGIGQVPQEWKEITEDPELIRRYTEDLFRMKEQVHICKDDLLRRYPEILFENGQGLLLSQEMKYRGYGNHTTPSNTGIENPARIMQSAFGGTDEIFSHAADELRVEAVYVTRSYMTRHGAGRFDTECPMNEINPDIRDLTNMPNDSQGTIRYGRLNMRSFLRRVKRDFAVWNQITPVPAGCAVCMTHLNEYDHCGARNKLVKYKSSSEEGAGCVTLNNNTR